MSFQNFDRVLNAFSAISIFVRHDNMKSATERLKNGKILQDISGVHAIREWSGYEEKVISMECHGTQEDLMQFVKEITNARVCVITLFDYGGFRKESEKILGDMAKYSALLLVDEPNQQYFQILDTKTGQVSTGVMASSGDRASMLMFIKAKIKD